MPKKPKLPTLGDPPVKILTGNYTLTLADAGGTVFQPLGTGGGSPVNVTVPPHSSVAFPIGTTITFMNADNPSGSQSPTVIVPGTGVKVYGLYANAPYTAPTDLEEWLVDAMCVITQVQQDVWYGHEF